MNVDELKQMLIERIAENRNDLDRISNVLLGQGHIVVSHSNLPLDFTIADGVVSAPKVSGFPGRVVRFSERDADAVAANVKDGAGRPSKAVHVRHAILAEIAQLESLLGSIA
jgi:hypothetical protein